MLSQQSIIRAFYRLLICVLGLAIWPVPTVFGFNLPQIYFTDYSLNRTRIEPGGEATGTVTLWNYDALPASDLALGYQLAYGSGGAKKILDERAGDAFTLAAGEKRTFKFSYWLPYRLPGGEDLLGAGLTGDGGLTLRVKVQNSLGTVLAWADKSVYSDSTGSFFTLDYLPDLLSANPGVLAQGESPELRFALTAPSDLKQSDTIALVIRYKTAREGNPSWRESDLPLEIGSDVRKTITYELPPFGEPGRYTTTIKVLNKGSGDVVSNSLEYSWIVKNPRGNAQIFFAALDKDAYTEGAIASLRVGFAAQDWNGGPDNKLKVAGKIFDGSGQIAGEAAETVKMSEREAVLRIPITRDVQNPKAAIQLIVGERTADSYEFPVKEQKDGADDNKPKLPDPALPGFWSLFFARFSLYVAVFAAIILAGAIVYYLKVIRPYLRKKQKKKAGKKALKKPAVSSGSMDDLLDEFNEIEKQNKRFKLPK
jgi:hypothetical protein